LIRRFRLAAPARRIGRSRLGAGQLHQHDAAGDQDGGEAAKDLFFPMGASCRQGVLRLTLHYLEVHMELGRYRIRS